MTAPVGRDFPARKAKTHGRKIEALARRPAPVVTSDIVYHIKLQSDRATIPAGDGWFVWTVPQDVDGYELTDVELSVTTVSSSGIVQVQLRNITQANDMLTTRVQVDATEFHSKDSATQPVVSATNDDVAHGDRIAFDFDAVGTGAKGHEIVLTFAPA